MIIKMTGETPEVLRYALTKGNQDIPKKSSTYSQDVPKMSPLCPQDVPKMLLKELNKELLKEICELELEKLRWIYTGTSSVS